METRKVCRQMNYQFTGYTVNGQGQKKSEKDDIIIIESMHDVSDLKYISYQIYIYFGFP